MLVPNVSKKEEGAGYLSGLQTVLHLQSVHVSAK